MSQIPPPIVVSGIGASYAAERLASNREAQEAADADARSRESRTVSEAGETVDATDEDMAVFSDSAGLGSQGREDTDASPEDENASEANSAAAPESTHTEPAGPMLDIEA